MPENTDQDSRAVEVVSNKIPARDSVDPEEDYHRSLLEERKHYFGERIVFYSAAGTRVGSLAIDNTPDPNDERREFAFRSFDVPNSYLFRDGGITCLYGFIHGKGFARVVAYGDTSVTRLPGSFDPCDDAKVDEYIRDDTNLIPGPNQSFQRTGFGAQPEDFRWTVAIETLGRQNIGQSFPTCGTECSSGFYSVRRNGVFGNCRDRCVRDFWARVRIAFLGWECGEC